MRTREQIEKTYNKKGEKGLLPIGELLEVLLDIRDLLLKETK